MTDDIHLADSEFVASHKLMGYRQVTDAHLLAIALRHGGRLATLDKGIKNVVPDGFTTEEVVCHIA